MYTPATVPLLRSFLPPLACCLISFSSLHPLRSLVPSKGLFPQSATICMLLGGCKAHRNSEAGRQAAGCLGAGKTCCSAGWKALYRRDLWTHLLQAPMTHILFMVSCIGGSSCRAAHATLLRSFAASSEAWALSAGSFSRPSAAARRPSTAACSSCGSPGHSCSSNKPLQQARGQGGGRQVRGAGGGFGGAARRR